MRTMRSVVLLACVILLSCDAAWSQWTPLNRPEGGAVQAYCRADNDTEFCMANARVWRREGGGSWDDVGPGTFSRVEELKSWSDTVVVMSDMGPEKYIHWSTDNGETWSQTVVKAHVASILPHTSAVVASSREEEYKYKYVRQDYISGDIQVLGLPVVWGINDEIRAIAGNVVMSGVYLDSARTRLGRAWIKAKTTDVSNWTVEVDTLLRDWLNVAPDGVGYVNGTSFTVIFADTTYTIRLPVTTSFIRNNSVAYAHGVWFCLARSIDDRDVYELHRSNDGQAWTLVSDALPDNISTIDGVQFDHLKCRHAGYGLAKVYALTADIDADNTGMSGRGRIATDGRYVAAISSWGGTPATLTVFDDADPVGSAKTIELPFANISTPFEYAGFIGFIDGALWVCYDSTIAYEPSTLTSIPLDPETARLRFGRDGLVRSGDFYFETNLARNVSRRHVDSTAWIVVDSLPSPYYTFGIAASIDGYVLGLHRVVDLYYQSVSMARRSFDGDSLAPFDSLETYYNHSQPQDYGIANTEGAIVVHDRNTVQFTSTDDGQTWQDRRTSGGYPAPNGIWRMASDNRLDRSTDGGATWEGVYTKTSHSEYRSSIRDRFCLDRNCYTNTDIGLLFSPRTDVTSVSHEPEPASALRYANGRLVSDRSGILQVYAVTGHLLHVLHSEAGEIDVSHLSTGVYLAVLTTATTTHTLPLFIN